MRFNSTAIIEQGSYIGKGTMIWHFSHIMPGASIGENCTIGQNVFIDQGVEIGSGCKIQNNVSVYKGVRLEDDVFIGPSVVFTNVMNPRAFIDRKKEILKTTVEQGASIGANSTILCGVTIGEYALIGAGSVVIKSVRPYSMSCGNPARHFKYITEEADIDMRYGKLKRRD